jgi:hypothetical protein
VLDGELGPEATGLLNKHLAQCPACGQEFERRKKVLALLGNTFQQKRISESFDVTANRKLIAMKETKEQPPVGFNAAGRKSRSPESKLMRAAAAPEDQDFNEEELEEEAAPKAGYFENLGAAPWWAVSLALHVLIIALASLVSMSIELPKSDDSVIMVTELSQRQELPTQEQEKKKESDLDALQSKHDTPPTDPNSKEASDIVVPPDILAKAELGDHFETINPDLPDTHSALGNPDSHSFHSVEGNTEPEGGGGMNGIGMEDMIGVGGAASKGTGGGFGGGDGTGTGVGTGAGHGSFGQRNGGGRKLMVKRHGGSKATENAVDKALEWLAYHQEADGHWDSKKYDGGKADYWKVPQCDTAVTALSTLAFLGAGHSEKVGTYKDNVKRAVAWLKSKQQPDGRVFDTADNCGFDHNLSLGYSIAMATMALSEAAGMANVPETKLAASKAVQYCVETHAVGNGSETGAWRYEPKMEADISVTGWFVMALKSAKVAGIHVPPSAFEGAIKFIDQMEIKNAGPDTGYGPASRYEYQKGVGTNHRRCAIGNLCRQFMGWKKEDLQSSVELFVKDGGIPEWTDKGDKQHDNKLDMYYWYYGTLCVFQQGGDLWKSWNEGLKGALVPNQRKGGDENGSWDPLGTYSECWGRVGSTALGALCLEVYYRYLQLSPDKH